MILQKSNTGAIDTFLRKHRTLEALPESTAEIMQMTADPNCNLARLLKLIEKDAALAGAIMKAVNSSFYSLTTIMTRLDRALAYLGTKAVKEIVLSTCLSKLCKAASYGTYSARDLWNHGLCVAVTARELATLSATLDSEEAFLIGMLHDIGLLLAAQAEIKQATAVLSQAELGTTSFADLERLNFGFNHCELGVALARNWSFQESHAAVIQYHHAPGEAPEEFRALCHHFYVADTLACQTTMGCPLTGKGQTIAPEQLAAAAITTEMIDEVMEKVPMQMRLYQV
jgi:putative nucleotidyltransferase with HDIG domain